MSNISKNKNGILYIVSTPIGNMEDITLRAIKILGEVDIIAAEDTRRSLTLLNHFQIKFNKLISYYNYNEAKRANFLIKELQEGKKIALVSDAGTPGISDPGFRIIKAALENNILVVPIPGVSAITTAISASGLSSESFSFYGYLPSKEKEKIKFLKNLVDVKTTLVFFESPKRLLKTLHNIFDILGNRRIVIAKELTKIYERFIRGEVSKVIEELSLDKPKGEFTILVEGKIEEEKVDTKIITDELKQYIEELGLSLKDSAKIISQKYNIEKNKVYIEGIRYKKIRQNKEKEDV